MSAARGARARYIPSIIGSGERETGPRTGVIVTFPAPADPEPPVTTWGDLSAWGDSAWSLEDEALELAARARRISRQAYADYRAGILGARLPAARLGRNPLYRAGALQRDIEIPILRGRLNGLTRLAAREDPEPPA